MLHGVRVYRRHIGMFLRTCLGGVSVYVSRLYSGVHRPRDDIWTDDMLMRDLSEAK